MESAVFLDVLGCVLTSLLALPFVLYIGCLYFALNECDILTALVKDKPSHYKSRVVWITGATSGIGKSLALLLSQQGAFVILSGRRADALKAVGNECKKKSFGEDTVLEVSFDVSKIEEIDVATTKAVKWKGHVDVLFNNAGLGSRGYFVDWEVDRTIFMTNLMGHVKLGKTLIPHFIENGAVGQIVNTSSIASLIPRPGRASYGSTKCAILHYFRALQQESQLLSMPNIRFTTCLPGFVDTSFEENTLRSKSKVETKKEHSLTSDRCASLMLRAASNNLEESWMGNKPELMGAYASYYMPQLFKVVWPLVRKAYLPAL